jgi:transcriptional regulator with XRE-family HTH domain
MTIGERVRIARKAAKMSGEKLGATIGVSKAQISNIENGSSDVTRSNAIVLSNVLGVSLDWLLFGVQVEEPNQHKVDLEQNKADSITSECEQKLALALVEIVGLKREIELYKKLIEALDKKP